MAKGLPYFKFTPTEWLTGDICFESFEVQGLFINICALYWQRDGLVSLEDINKRYKKPTALDSLLDRFISVNDGFISISFLDEQFIDRNHISKTNSLNGSKGGRPKILDKKPNVKRTKSELNPIRIRKEEEIEKEVDKEITIQNFKVTDLIITNILEMNSLLSHWSGVSKLSPERTRTELKNFLEDKKAIEKPYENIADLKSHISNWFKSNKFETEIKQPTYKNLKLQTMDKITPQELEYEQAILGACMLDSEAFNKISSILDYSDFYEPNHREIYKAFVKLSTDNKNIDMLTVRKIFDMPVLIAQLCSKVSSSANIEFYSAVVKEKAIAREIIETCQYGLLNVYDTTDIFDLQAKILNRFEAKLNLKSKDPVEFNKVVSDTIKKIEDIQKSDKHITGIDTMFRDINEISNGWHSPDLTIIAARPGVGKTAFSLNIALNVARQNIGVAFFTLEMSGEQLAYRCISILSGVYNNYLKKANLTEYNWNSIMEVDYDLPIYIDDTAGLNILDFKEKARKLKRTKNIKMIVVDYLQLMNANVKGSREQEISTISRTLKHIAKELDVCVIALAQLSRDVEKRGGDMKPRLSDLRESGAIEQDADNVIFLCEQPNLNESDEVIMEAIYAKHRNGSIGSVDLNFNKGKQLFSNI